MKILRILLILVILTPLSLASAAANPLAASPREQAEAMLQKMNPEERVGQLFLVTFNGNQVGTETLIYDLITNHHIGGVILLSANDNFVSGDNELSQIVNMNRDLQLDRWNFIQQPHLDPASGTSYNLNFVPLFISISQEGDGYPNDQILNGLTQLPNEMALGATWDPGLTANVGSVMGQELSALGFNLLIGPSLDVLERPRPEDPSDLGTRTFGGDPYWVGVMGRAYIQGVHEGSQGRLAVIAKHFPGNGGADRLPEEEVAIVRKSLEQLKKFDLKPFYAVTGNAIAGDHPQPEAAADGLLAAHIRYQGYSENIRVTTRPVSLDQQRFEELMNIPELALWRNNGGVMISDNLGSLAVRRFYDTTGQTYDARRVAQSAFQAGNDLLYLGDVTSGEDPDSYTTTVNILSNFTQKYRTDPSFAQRVDESVLRILTLKYHLYQDFSLQTVLPPLEGIDSLGKADQVSFQVARQAATLISPPLSGLDDAIPDAPSLADRIVFISEASSTRQCKLCQAQPILDVNAMKQAVLRLYGSQGGGQVLPGNLDSYSFDDLAKMLDSPRNTTQIETDLRRAHWIVFSILKESTDGTTSQPLVRFLAERTDLFQRKRLIVFAFNAPYFLDATSISKVTAYFGLYSKSPSFIDVAARLLFRELPPPGALPVSVPGVGYDLILATSPNPDQAIPLFFNKGQAQVPVPTGTQEPTVVPTFRLGDQAAVFTGVIYDHNGHTVPDGTPVQFIQTVNGMTTSLPAVETKDGIASAAIQVASSGSWEIRAESEPAKSSVLRFEVPSETGEIVTITPTLAPTETPLPTATATTPPPVITTPEPPKAVRPNLSDWFMAILLTVVIALSSYRVAALIGYVRWGVRGGFLALIGGLIAYSYIALGMPGSQGLLNNLGAWGIVLTTSFGCVLGIGAAWAWRAVRVSIRPGAADR